MNTQFIKVNNRYININDVISFEQSGSITRIFYKNWRRNYQASNEQCSNYFDIHESFIDQTPEQILKGFHKQQFNEKMDELLK